MTDRPQNFYNVPSAADLRWYYEDFRKRRERNEALSEDDAERAEDIEDWLDMEERIERHARVVARLRENPVERPPRQRRFINPEGVDYEKRFSTVIHHIQPRSTPAYWTTPMYVAEWVRTNKYQHRPQQLVTTRQLQARKALGSE